MSLREVIQKAIPGWDGRVAGHHIGYLADLHVHRELPYVATDPKIVAKKIALQQSQGININITTWQGPWATSCHLDATLTAAECSRVGMQFALLLDPGGMQKWTGNRAVATQNAIAALQDKTTQALLNGSSYLPEKYVLDFDTGADLVALAKAFPTLKFLAKGKDFSWISIPKITESKARNAAAVADLKAQHASPSMKIASVCDGFNDAGQPLPVGVQSQALFDAAGGKRDFTKGVWGDDPARILESFEGLFMEQQLATIPATVPIIAALTIDDVDEGTNMERKWAEDAGETWV